MVDENNLELEHTILQQFKRKLPYAPQYKQHYVSKLTNPVRLSPGSNDVCRPVFRAETSDPDF